VPDDQCAWLLEAVRSLHEEAKAAAGGGAGLALAQDDIFPILCFCAVRAGLRRPHAAIGRLLYHSFSLEAEAQYYATSLHAALAFVSSLEPDAGAPGGYRIDRERAARAQRIDLAPPCDETVEEEALARLRAFLEAEDLTENVVESLI
jgi:hypothetical protein